MQSCQLGEQKLKPIIQQFIAGAHRDSNGFWSWNPTPDIQHVRTELEFLGYIRKDRLKDNTCVAYPITQLGQIVLKEWLEPTPQSARYTGLGGRGKR